MVKGPNLELYTLLIYSPVYLKIAITFICITLNTKFKSCYMGPCSYRIKHTIKRMQLFAHCAFYAIRTRPCSKLACIWNTKVRYNIGFISLHETAKRIYTLYKIM